VSGSSGLIALCGALSVMQAARFERLSFDPFPLVMDRVGNSNRSSFALNFDRRF
jgi:hypothetical protein